MERTFASALVLMAHPDDGDFMCGGTVAAWVRAGTEVHYVIITDGSAGSNEPGKTREPRSHRCASGSSAPRPRSWA